MISEITMIGTGSRFCQIICRILWTRYDLLLAKTSARNSRHF
uniref:Uncharacterized protein n=1 Tax=Arundo donax TaxID=35708 RepID=A0A0A9HGG2_ARUDO